MGARGEQNAAAPVRTFEPRSIALAALLVGALLAYHALIGYDPDADARDALHGAEEILFSPTGSSPEIVFAALLWILWQRSSRILGTFLERPLPLLGVHLHHFVYARQEVVDAGAAQAVEDLQAFFAHGDQASRAQHCQVPGDGGHVGPHDFLQLAYTPLTLGERVHHHQPAGVGQGLHDAGTVLVKLAVHLLSPVCPAECIS